MKRCSRCHIEKPFEAFSPRRNRNNAFHSRCRECHVKEIKEWRLANPDWEKAKYDRKRFARRYMLINHYVANPCVDCGELDPVVLEFDHIKEKGDKSFNIGGLSGNVSIKKVIAEMAKCEVRCANCHRRMTAARNPAHWSHRYKDLIESLRAKRLHIVMAGSQGVEPRPSEPKPLVLPLHHEPIRRGRTPGVQLLLI